jgi:hypothetical protein
VSQDPTRAFAIAQHRQQTERTLVVLRTDDSLDDREKGRRITQVIAAANARLVELVGRRPAAIGHTSATGTPPLDLARRRAAARHRLAGPPNVRWA